MTFIYELDRTAGRYTRCANTNFPCQGFRKSSSDRQTDKLSVVTSGHVTKMVVVTPFDPCSRKLHATHVNLMALTVIEPELWAITVYIAEIGILDVFGSCDLEVNLVTFIYELDPYCT